MRVSADKLRHPCYGPRLLPNQARDIASDGYLYFTADQSHRQADYHDGNDLRERPYRLFRVKTDGAPVRLALTVRIGRIENGRIYRATGTACAGKNTYL